MTSITPEKLVCILGGMALGYWLAKRGGLVAKTADTAHNDIAGPGDWWTFAGSWSV